MPLRCFERVRPPPDEGSMRSRFPAASPGFRPSMVARCAAVSMALGPCFVVTACSTLPTPTASAMLVGSPVMVGPVTRLGGDEEPAPTGPTFEVVLGNDVTAFQGEKYRSSTMKTDAQGKLDVEIMKQTGMDDRQWVKIVEIDARAHFWWALVGVGYREQLSIQAQTHSVED